MKYLNNLSAVEILDADKIPEDWKGLFSVSKYKVFLPDHHFSSSAMFLIDNAEEYNCFALPKNEETGEFTLVSVAPSYESNLTKAETTIIEAFIKNQTTIGYLLGIEGVFNDNHFSEIEDEDTVAQPVESEWI